MAAPSSLSWQQNSHWALMINKTLLTMRGTQSVLVLAESEKDSNNYSLNRQSPRWRPHNRGCVCILGSFHSDGLAGEKKIKWKKNRGNKVGKSWSHRGNTVAWGSGVTGGSGSLKGCISTWNHTLAAEVHEEGRRHEWWKNGEFSRIICSEAESKFLLCFFIFGFAGPEGISLRHKLEQHLLLIYVQKYINDWT